MPPSPELHLATSGESRFYARVGVEHYRHEADGSFTQLDSNSHSLVAYGKTAEWAYDRLRVSDNFLASGYISECEVERNAHTGPGRVRGSAHRARPRPDDVRRRTRARAAA